MILIGNYVVLVVAFFLFQKGYQEFGPADDEKLLNCQAYGLVNLSIWAVVSLIASFVDDDGTEAPAVLAKTLTWNAAVAVAEKVDYSVPSGIALADHHNVVDADSLTAVGSVDDVGSSPFGGLKITAGWPQLLVDQMSVADSSSEYSVLEHVGHDGNFGINAVVGSVAEL